MLEGATIKWAAVATDLLGKSGRAMLEALVGGASDSTTLAHLARGRLRAKIPQFEQALNGHFSAHHRSLIAEQLAHSDALQASIERVRGEIAQRVRPGEGALQQLQTIPGVGRRTAEILVAELLVAELLVAEILVAEIGVDRSRFTSARHLASWAALCPGNDESGGTRRSGRTRKGSPWLRTAVVEAARAAARRKKETDLAAQYRRLAARRGAKRAAVAVAHSILAMVSALLTRHESYRELGGHYLDERDRQIVERRLVRRLEALGYAVSLQPTTPAA